MDAIDRSESPSGRKRSSSRLSNLSNQDADSDSKEPTIKRRVSKRRTRNGDKENGEVDVGTNVESARLSEDQGMRSIEEKGVEVKEVNGVNESGDEKVQVETIDPDATREACEMSSGDAELNIVEDAGGSAESVAEAVEEVKEKDEEDEHIREERMEKDEETSVNGNGNVEEGSAQEMSSPDTATEDEMGSREYMNESIAMDTEESYVTAETGSYPPARAYSSEILSKDLNTTQEEDESEAEPCRKETENGLSDESTVEEHVPAARSNARSEEENMVVEESESRKGFLRKWSFKLTSDKKEPETNGHGSSAEDTNNIPLYFSSIRGRPPVWRSNSNNTLEGKAQETSMFYRVLKTPNNVRNLDDSFIVKSEPSRSNRGEGKDKPSLRKFPAKRCLNADEPEEKDESLLPSGSLTKRRKLDGNETRTGFLKSFLWSPFRKRTISDVEEEATAKTAVTENPKSAVSKVVEGFQLRRESIVKATLDCIIRFD